jgi:hypothetical protein
MAVENQRRQYQQKGSCSLKESENRGQDRSSMERGDYLEHQETG